MYCVGVLFFMLLFYVLLGLVLALLPISQLLDALLKRMVCIEQPSLTHASTIPHYGVGIFLVISISNWWIKSVKAKVVGRYICFPRFM